MIHIEGTPSELTRPTVLTGNVFNDGTVTYSSNATDGPNSHDGNTYDAWAPDAVPASIAVDMGTATAVDCLCLTAHDCGTNGNTITVEYLVGAVWTTAATIVPTTDATIMAIWVSKRAAEWRVTFSGGTAPTIGVIALGKRLVFARGIVGDYTPTNWASEIDVLGGDTIGGQFLGQRIIRRGASTMVTPGTVSRDWFEAAGVNFTTHYDEAKPFFYCGGPRTVPNDLAYCWRPENGDTIQPRYVEAGLYVRLSFRVACYVPT